MKFQHPDYNHETRINDIAVLQLKTPVSFSEFVQPACLPNPSYDHYPSIKKENPAFTSGWVCISIMHAFFLLNICKLDKGISQKANDSRLDVLHNVELDTYPNSYCPEATFPNTNWNSQICAG